MMSGVSPSLKARRFYRVWIIVCLLIVVTEITIVFTILFGECTAWRGECLIFGMGDLVAESASARSGLSTSIAR